MRVKVQQQSETVKVPVLTGNSLKKIWEAIELSKYSTDQLEEELQQRYAREFICSDDIHDASQGWCRWCGRASL
jgi:hypothetical protein